jgi:MFS transporter, AAHS family, 4-hydroxybenzoate transporter
LNIESLLASHSRTSRLDEKFAVRRSGNPAEMHMQAIRHLDLDELFNTSPVHRLQVLIITLCAFVAFIDGFNTQVIALVAPEIARLWRLPPAAFGPVFSAGVFGGSVGALLAGTCSDRFGRKWVLVGCVFLFAVASLATVFVVSRPSLILVRAISGVGLGGAMPGIVSITSEYAPARLRATLISLMFCGFPLGAVVAAAAASWLIPALGWRSAFYLGSVPSLLLVPALALLMPESIRFLAARADRAGVASVLKRLGWADRWNGELPTSSESARTSVTMLFHDNRAMATVLLWMALFLSLLLTYFLSNWLPMLSQQAGVGIRGAILSVSALNLGAVCGSLLIGRLIDRFGPVVPVAVGYTLGAAAVALLGLAANSGALLLLFALLTGMTMIGAQMCTLSLIAFLYPTSLRATGVGWCMAVGRIGAIAGPLLGGLVIGAGFATASLYFIGGLLSLGSACLVLGLKVSARNAATHRPPPPVAA